MSAPAHARLRQRGIGLSSLEWLNESPFAHRGLHEAAAGVPENSPAAFEAAVDAGYGIELDVRLTADGIPVVFHDATLERMTELEGRVAGLSAAELTRARLMGTNQRIPRLGDALRLVRGRAPLLVELKNSWRRPGPLETAVWEVLEDYPGPCAVLSFNPLSLAWFHRHAPAMPRGQNTARAGRGYRGQGAPTSPRLSRLLGQPHFISYQIGSLSHRIAARIRAHGLPLITWTVRTEAERERALLYADNFMFEGFRP